WCPQRHRPEGKRPSRVFPHLLPDLSTYHGRGYPPPLSPDTAVVSVVRGCELRHARRDVESQHFLRGTPRTGRAGSTVQQPHRDRFVRDRSRDVHAGSDGSTFLTVKAEGDGAI